MRALILIIAIAITAAGCTVYEPVVVPPRLTYDKAWNAAVAAMREQGVAITAQDSAGGVVTGHRGDIELTATVRTQPDGNIQVEFHTTGTTSDDPQLIERVSRSYKARIRN